MNQESRLSGPPPPVVQAHRDPPAQVVHLGAVVLEPAAQRPGHDREHRVVERPAGDVGGRVQAGYARVGEGDRTPGADGPVER